MNNHEDRRSVDQIADEVANKVRQSVYDFLTKIRTNSSDTQSVLTIDELERYWGILDSATQTVYAEMIGKELSSINEQPLIESKKGNMHKRGWS